MKNKQYFTTSCIWYILLYSVFFISSIFSRWDTHLYMSLSLPSFYPSARPSVHPSVAHHISYRLRIGKILHQRLPAIISFLSMSDETPTHIFTKKNIDVPFLQIYQCYCIAPPFLCLLSALQYQCCIASCVESINCVFSLSVGETLK